MAMVSHSSKESSPTISMAISGAADRRLDATVTAAGEDVLEAVQPVAAFRELRDHGGIGQDRQLDANGLASFGPALLDGGQFLQVERAIEAEADDLVHGRTRSGKERQAAVERQHERAAGRVHRRRHHQPRAEPRLGSVDPRRERRISKHVREILSATAAGLKQQESGKLDQPRKRETMKKTTKMRMPTTRATTSILRNKSSSLRMADGPSVLPPPLPRCRATSGLRPRLLRLALGYSGLADIRTYPLERTLYPSGLKWSLSSTKSSGRGWPLLSSVVS